MRDAEVESWEVGKMRERGRDARLACEFGVLVGLGGARANGEGGVFRLRRGVGCARTTDYNQQHHGEDFNL